MKIEEVDVSRYPDYDQHEKVLRCSDEASGLHAFIAIHNRTLGPAVGGCRMWNYPSEEAAITDVLRLSRGMTYKSAAAGLPLGGGKAVIMGDPAKDKSPALMAAMGEFVDSLAGTYITAEDSGISVEDLAQAATRTPHVAGITRKHPGDGSGDPSPSTAYGIFKGIEAAAAFYWNKPGLGGRTVAIQGVGHVGHKLAVLLKRAGADLIIADVSQARIDETLADVDASVVPGDEIHRCDVDILAPCALGGFINAERLGQMPAPIIAGAANNQLATPDMGFALQQRGKLYAPDYVINAGGIIDIYCELNGFDHDRLVLQLDGIGTALTHIFETARRQDKPTHVVADELAESRFRPEGASKASRVA